MNKYVWKINFKSIKGKEIILYSYMNKIDENINENIKLYKLTK